MRISRMVFMALAVVLAGAVLPAGARAQVHQHPGAARPAPADTARPAPQPQPAKVSRPVAQDTTKVMEHEMPGMAGHDMGGMAGMQPGPLGIAREREGSGTAWLPDASPMYAWHRQSGAWELMLHGSLFVQYFDEGGDRGDSQFGSTNWLMGMARRPLGGGDLTLRAMGSLDPLTVGECGYPSLLSTGEFCEGEPIHDRQHPHDLFMELAGVYERALSDGLALQLYGGPVGEPALGPAAFPHRISALSNPQAPIAHHWLDSTHIAFGVATAGLFGPRWKLEGSLFNGREPDAERYDINLDALDSYAGRFWFLPTERWALQVSGAHLNEAESPEEDGPRIDVRRLTASATYHRPLANQGVWANTVAWGHNREEGLNSNALLAETNLNFGERDIMYARAEWTEKTREDLVLEDGGSAAATVEPKIFNVGKLAVGYLRQFTPRAGFVAGLGAGVSVSRVPDSLEAVYGSTAPVGLQLFLRVRPAPMARHGGSAEAPEHGR